MPFQLQAPFSPAGDQPAAIAALTKGLQEGLQRQTLLGVTGSGKTFTLAHVIQQVQRPTIILAPNKILAAQLYGEMRGFFPNNAVEYFVSYFDYYQPEAYKPASDTYIEKDSAINEYIEQMRLSAVKALLERQDAIIVASVSAIYGLGDPQSYLKMVVHLTTGEKIAQRTLLRRLAELQYTRNDDVLERANYRVRGDVIDVYPAESDKAALRIELFDEVIEQLSYFDPLTGEQLYKVSKATIYPKTHFVTPRENLLKAVDTIKIELKERLETLYRENKLVEAQRLEQRTRFDLEMMLELGYCSGIENYSRHLSGMAPGEPPATLLDYLPKGSLVVIDESHVTVPQLTGMYRGDRARKETLVEYGFRLPSALDNRPLRFDEFEVRSPETIYVSATPGTFEITQSSAIIEQVVRPTGLIDPEVIVKPATSQVDDLLSEIHLQVAQQARVLVTTLTKRMAEDLSEYLMEQGIRARYLHSDIDTVERIEMIRDLRLGEFDVLVGINLLREGLDIPEVALVAIMDADKEGFLRSERSLIQTIGRAARHLQGKAILYADRITESMKKAMDETKRRREKQTEYNRLHNITPQGIQKAVQHLMIAGQQHLAQERKEEQALGGDAIALSPQALLKHIQATEKDMRQCARNLEFEKAAAFRDQIKRLKAQLKQVGG